MEYNIQTSSNAEEMTAQLDDLMTWGQAIVAFPQWEGMEVPMERALDAGIIIVNFDIVIDLKAFTGSPATTKIWASREPTTL